MAESAPDPQGPAAFERRAPVKRADAVASRDRILEAASALRGHRRTSMVEIAAAAGVGRSTLYRHFPTRRALEEAIEERAAGSAQPQLGARAGRVSTLPYQAPGQLGRAQPLALEVTRVLDEVPPHLVPDQLVAEARRVAGVAVALYVVDIDGSNLLRLAGTEEFPERLEDPPALGPEIVPEGLPAFYARLERQLRGCIAEPLWLRGRVMGLLLCLGTPVNSLARSPPQRRRWRSSTPSPSAGPNRSKMTPPSLSWLSSDRGAAAHLGFGARTGVCFPSGPEPDWLPGSG